MPLISRAAEGRSDALRIVKDSLSAKRATRLGFHDNPCLAKPRWCRSTTGQKLHNYTTPDRVRAVDVLAKHGCPFLSEKPTLG